MRETVGIFEGIEENVERQILCARIAHKQKVSPVSRVYSDTYIASTLAVLKDFWHLSLLSNLSPPSTRIVLKRGVGFVLLFVWSQIPEGRNQRLTESK